MKLCADDKVCPYQSHFDTLWRLEATDPGLCESFLSQPDSKCLLRRKTAGGSPKDSIASPRDCESSTIWHFGVDYCVKILSLNVIPAPDHLKKVGAGFLIIFKIIHYQTEIPNNLLFFCFLVFLLSFFVLKYTHANLRHGHNKYQPRGQNHG